MGGSIVKEPVVEEQERARLRQLDREYYKATAELCGAGLLALLGVAVIVAPGAIVIYLLWIFIHAAVRYLGG